MIAYFFPKVRNEEIDIPELEDEEVVEVPVTRKKNRKDRDRNRFLDKQKNIQKDISFWELAKKKLRNSLDDEGNAILERKIASLRDKMRIPSRKQKRDSQLEKSFETPKKKEISADTIYLD